MTAEQDVGDSARKARLRRLERVFVPAPIYFVTANTANRLSILTVPEIHSAFLEFARIGEDRGAFVGAYVLMPDHMHLFVALDPETTLAAWVKSLKNSLSKTLRNLNVPAPHWQKGFFDHVLRSTDSYAQKWEDVRDNPVRAGLVGAWQEWPYSGEVTCWSIATDFRTLRRDLEDHRFFRRSYTAATGTPPLFEIDFAHLLLHANYLDLIPQFVG